MTARRVLRPVALTAAYLAALAASAVALAGGTVLADIAAERRDLTRARRAHRERVRQLGADLGTWAT